MILSNIKSPCLSSSTLSGVFLTQTIYLRSISGIDTCTLCHGWLSCAAKPESPRLRTWEKFAKFLTCPVEKSTYWSKVTHSAKCIVLIGPQRQPGCNSLEKISLITWFTMKACHHELLPADTSSLQGIHLLPSVYHHVFPLRLTLKWELLGKPGKLFSLKTFQTPQL